MNHKRVLITGGAGFIGINLVDYLLKSGGYKITVLDNLSTGNYGLLKKIAEDNGAEIEEKLSGSHDKVHFVKGDILDKKIIPGVMKNREAVVHLAAQTGVMPSLDNPLQDASINITGTLNLLTASVENNVKAFILASSAASLGEQEPPLHEKKIPRPLAPYGASKLAAEGYCTAFCGSYGLNTTALRFSNVYGPNSFHKGSVVAHFIKKILKDEPLTVYGDGEQTRDFLHAGDIVRVIEQLLNNPGQKKPGEIFQLGTGVETTINQLVKSLETVVGSPLETVFKPERKGEVKRNYASIEKIKSQLGYYPQFGLEAGLRNTWDWFRRGRS